LAIEFKAGDEFIVQGSQWICLKIEQYHIVALQIRTMCVMNVRIKAIKKKTDRTYPKLIEAIEKAHSDLTGGSPIYFDSYRLSKNEWIRKEEYTVKQVNPDGSILVTYNPYRQFRIHKWDNWWSKAISPEYLPTPDPSMDNSEFLWSEIRHLRTGERGRRHEAMRRIQKCGREAVPLLVQNIKDMNDEPSNWDKLAITESACTFGEIAQDDNLKFVLELIEEEEELRSYLLDLILSLNRCRAYSTESLKESIAGSTFSAEVVFQILAKKRGKPSVQMLAEAAANEPSGEKRKLALEYLKSMETRESKRAVKNIESGSK